MRINNVLLLVTVGTFLGFPLQIQPQVLPASGLYQITSGKFTACCGLLGPISVSLPEPQQTFVRLNLEPSGRVSMTFLGSDRTPFSVFACTTDAVVFTLEGFASPNSSNIIFHADPGPPPLRKSFSYIVDIAGDTLRINGQLGFVTPFCADVPSQFNHSNVVAQSMPTATVRVSDVEVCWNSRSNRNYQVQYRSALASNGWINLGAVQAGNGTTNCITDKVVPGEPRRFYRVEVVP
jgi:hypothetical protein